MRGNTNKSGFTYLSIPVRHVTIGNHLYIIPGLGVIREAILHYFHFTTNRGIFIVHAVTVDKKEQSSVPSISELIIHNDINADS
jgi:hypothetical protein